jgi:hypothetical protein
MKMPAIKNAFEANSPTTNFQTDRGIRSIGSALSTLGGQGPVLLVLSCAQERPAALWLILATASFRYLLSF